MKFQELQKQSNRINSAQYEVINLTVLSDISLEPYFDPLCKSNFILSHLYPQVQAVRYEEYKSHLDIIKKSDLTVILLNFENLFPDCLNDIYSEKADKNQIKNKVTDLCKEIYLTVKSVAKCPVLWFGFEDYGYNLHVVHGSRYICHSLIDEINQGINLFLDESDIFIDTKHIIANIGIQNVFDRKGKYRWNAPYSKHMISAITQEIHKQYLICKGKSKKCIILDCDNVLWGGILSEDGIENIKLGGDGFGRPYQDFQRFLLTLYWHGVILAVCSKNDMKDVRGVFQSHSGMILKEEHIACFQVNWSNKADNIKAIAGSLNIGLDSMVFIDDSPFEVESVKALLPEVTCILYNYNTVYEQLSCFNLNAIIDIDGVNQRNETYRTNKQRERLKKDSTDFEDYLRALEMRVDIHEAVSVEYARIAELSQRTNKCTNGRRYTVSELKQKLSQGTYKLLSVSLSDRFSDLGLVGTIGLEGGKIDLFALSCRALGRNVEKVMIEFVTDKNIDEFYFLSTGKNEDLKILLESAVKSIVL